MARAPVDEGDVEELEARSRGSLVAHRRGAETFESWADDPQPDDEVTVGQLLVHAGEQWLLADGPENKERALSCFRRAVATEDAVDPDGRVYLLNGLLECRLREEADELASALRASRPRDPMVHLFAGEAFEGAGDLDEAVRWFTAGMFRAISDDDIPEISAVMLMKARARARAAMGFPPDDYDELAAEGMEPD